MRFAILVLLLACSPRPQAVEPAPSATPWCFRLALTWNDGTEQGKACGSTQEVCEATQRRAVRFGGAAGIREVGQCRAE